MQQRQSRPRPGSARSSVGRHAGRRAPGRGCRARRTIRHPCWWVAIRSSGSASASGQRRGERSRWSAVLTQIDHHAGDGPRSVNSPAVGAGCARSPSRTATSETQRRRSGPSATRALPPPRPPPARTARPPCRGRRGEDPAARRREVGRATRVARTAAAAAVARPAQLTTSSDAPYARVTISAQTVAVPPASAGPTAAGAVPGSRWRAARRCRATSRPASMQAWRGTTYAAVTSASGSTRRPGARRATTTSPAPTAQSSTERATGAPAATSIAPPPMSTTAAAALRIGLTSSQAIGSSPWLRVEESAGRVFHRYHGEGQRAVQETPPHEPRGRACRWACSRS